MPMTRRRWLRSGAAVTIGSFSTRFAARPSIAFPTDLLKTPWISDRERIVFFGDSITQGGRYVAHLETLLRLRFPKASVEIHNHGISSETISGTSEPDHDPRRPWAHERFTRDVADWRPTTLVACFGMNDGNYHPFDEDRFARFREGVLRLVDRARSEAQVRTLVICTPPPYDPYQRRNNDPGALRYGYKYPAVTYDETLRRYSEWLVSLRKDGLRIVDLHTPMNDHLARRRQERVSFTLMPDAVHPDSTGHAVMAVTMARQLGLDGPRDTLSLAAGLDIATAESGQATIVSRSADSTEITWQVPATWEFGPEADADSLTLEGVDEAFRSLRVKAAVEPEGQYELTIDSGDRRSTVSRRVTGRDLAEGIVLHVSGKSESAAQESGTALAEAVMKHRQTASAAWRSRAMKLPRDAEERGPQLEELAVEAAAGAALTAQAGKLVDGPRLKIERVRA